MSPLNDDAPANKLDIYNTLEVSQEPMSPLNDDAPSNILVISLMLLKFQLLKS